MSDASAIGGILDKSSRVKASENLVELTDQNNNLDITWDKQDALNRIGGSEALLKTLTEIFARDGLNQMQAFKAAILAADYTEAGFIAHSVKGVAANLGGLKLQQTAATLEHAAKTKNDSVINAELPELETQTQALIHVFENFLENGAQSRANLEQGEVKIEAEEFVHKMRILYTNLQANDYIDPVELALLSHVNVSAEIQTLINRFVEAVKQFENLSAMAILREIESISGFDLSPNGKEEV